MKQIIDLMVQLLTSWGLTSNFAKNLSITILFIGSDSAYLYYRLLSLKESFDRQSYNKIANKSKTDFDNIMLCQ